MGLMASSRSPPMACSLNAGHHAKRGLTPLTSASNGDRHISVGSSLCLETSTYAPYTRAGRGMAAQVDRVAHVYRAWVPRGSHRRSPCTARTHRGTILNQDGPCVGRSRSGRHQYVPSYAASLNQCLDACASR